jgi:predicted PurR-regulated permease PerM
MATAHGGLTGPPQHPGENGPLQRQVLFWLAALIAAGFLLYELGDILLPFVAGMAVAYLLDPVADRLEALGVGRLGATILILSLFVLFFVLVLVLLVPVVVQQLGALLQGFPGYAARLQGLIAEEGAPFLRRLGVPDITSSVQSSVGDLLSQGANWLGTFARSLWSGGRTIVSVISLLVVTPVVAFYLLVDWDRMIRAIDGWVPPRRRPTVRALAREMDRAVAGFVRGQSAVCIILGSYYAVGLSLVGLNFGALIGMMSGLISFVPYVGSLSGLLLSLTVALVQFWPDWTWILATLGVYLVGQFFEGNILSPKLVGASVGLHPVWVMFALLAFGSVFGFVGLLLAVPLAAMVGVLARFALRQYLASPLYEEPATILVITPDQAQIADGESLAVLPRDA